MGNRQSGIVSSVPSRSGRCLAALSAILALAGCESGVRQDPLMVRGASTATIMPAVPQKAPMPQPEDDQVISSAVAYDAPPTPSYADRPLSENIAGSLEIADYAHEMEVAGLMPLLRRAGPYTVFAIPNAPLESFMGQTPDAARMRRLLAYTVVPGRWDQARLRKKMARAHATQLGLKTIEGDVLTVAIEPKTNQLVLMNAAGTTNHLWLTGAPQSNGVLYFTQGTLPPAALATTTPG